MLRTILAHVSRLLKESGILPSYQARKRLAVRYLKGAGLEIGPLHQPTPLPPGVRVTYVDYATQQENIRRFPEIDPSGIVTTDLIDDGFTLSTITDASQDFIIANHVLEHAANPIQVLVNWERLLKPGGIMFLSVPIGARCFDKGRAITSPDHFVADYQAVKGGDRGEFDRMNREHYREWLTISAPSINRSKHGETPPRTDAELAEQVQQMAEESAEIHFHVFSRESLVALLDLVTRRYLPALHHIETQRSKCGAEYIAILKKTGSNGLFGAGSEQA